MPFRPVVSSKFTQDKIELVARLDENAKLSDRNTETLLPMPKLTFKKVLYRIGKEEETLPIKKPTVITQRGESKKLILKRLKAFYFFAYYCRHSYLKSRTAAAMFPKKKLFWLIKNP